MQPVVIAGIETVAGANLATGLKTHSPVVGIIATGPAIPIPGCSVEVCSDPSAEGPRRLLQRLQPARLVLCGPGAASCWDDERRPSAAAAQHCRSWIDAAAAEQIPLTLISSDAVFSGPWMFHPESSQSWCPSPEAVVLRQLEDQATSSSAQNMVLRTNVFGWTPGDRPGWLERMLDRLASGEPVEIDGSRHATPILAADLADILSRAWAAGLTGIYHLAGAERINPISFLRKLAVEFALPQPQGVSAAPLVQRAEGFGCGETSLQTRKLRRALGIALPLVTEGLRRLYQQQVTGYRSALQQAGQRPGRVA